VDELHVFSKEKDPFYNRVLLPEYVSEDSLEALEKLKKGELQKIGISPTFQGIGISEIDRKNKNHNGTTDGFEYSMILSLGNR